MKNVCKLLLALCYGHMLNGLTTAVIIPCYYGHAHHLFSLLKLYEQQTVLPDKVVIALSEAHRVAPELIMAINNEPWLFPVKLVSSDQKRYAGPNRNSACAHADGDILICQDADDVPHPQRVEAIKYFFQKYHVDHLLHKFHGANKDNEPEFALYNNIGDITYSYPKKYTDTYKIGNVTNGNVSILKKVFKKNQWSNKRRGQDTEFNKKIYKKRRLKKIVIKAPLIAYRAYLSSTLNR